MPDMPYMRNGAALVIVLFFGSCTGVLRAQSTNGSIAGRVTDPSKAVIIDAKVAAISVDTNVHYEGATNSSGEYYLTNLPPRSYRIEIEKTGFQKLIKPDVILHVQDALEINFEMAVGEVADCVTVEAGAPAATAISRAEFHDAFANQHAPTTPGSFLEHGRIIDWIFTRGPVRAGQPQVHRSVSASDHYPLSINLAIV